MNKSEGDWPAKILVVDDHPRARESMSDILRCAGHQVECRASAIEALRDLEQLTVDLVISDLRMPGMNGLEFIRALHQRRIDAQVLMVTAHASVETAVEAMRHGAFDYIEKPFTADQLEQLVARALRNGEGQRSSVLPQQEALSALVGNSPTMQSLRRRIAQLAPTDETVLITGESGVGKELVARAIHAASHRAEHALVSVNCPALSPQLMESELFGHERGSFTSADAPRVGRFELAEAGTILLDEVTEIGLPLQAKLLRVLQEKAYERVGESETRSADVRVMAASNRDLQDEVAAGRFRQDLYFRLAVVPLAVPPLRDRREDLPELIEHFRRAAAERLQRETGHFGDDALDLLTNYHWPGNVRELENLVTRACVMCSGEAVAVEDLRLWLIEDPGRGAQESTSADAPLPVGMNLHEMERRLIEATLERFQGHRAQTAQALGIGVRTLSNKLRAYGYAPHTKTFAKAA